MGEIGSTDDFILEARDKSNVPQLYFYTSAPDAPTMHQSSLIGLLCLAVLPPANAQQQPPKEGTPPPTFEFGFEQRVRNEDWNNILDYSGRTDDEREQIRYRTRGWFKAPLSSDVDVFVGLNQETNQKLGKDNRFDEIIFENAYIDIKKLFVKGLSLRVGRQNLMKGEGFLMFEGTPGDGSRTIYFNAVDLVYTRKKSKIELIGILQPKYDRLFPVIHDQHKPLQDWDQSSLGFYYTDNNHKNMPFEAYYFYTKEVKDYLPATNPQFQPDRHVSTLGGRTVRQFLHGWSATGEFAVQWGAQHPDVVVHGWGGYTYVKKQFAGGWKPYLQAGWWGFSGDDPNTSGTIEGWDPLYSRWPKWSELYIYSQVPERGVGYWTNSGMWQGEIGVAPRKTIAARFTYYHMTAFHPYPGNQNTFGPGTGRGENVQARVDFMPNKHWKAHVLYESQLPGDFYRVRNTGYFLRFEVSYLMTTKMTTGEFRHALGLKPPTQSSASLAPVQ
jgi:hypothetical protein